ncbi:hypothetical protein SS50377_23521 [Spironucleus salmonicida]|uniref:Uncharacterized protein n=1 Tax=Spironucleus salmonicida TaxID=348837 RepID=V6LV89_9EUKA|nr:hypothetical protein SS50377_23517 [Spironucleus salmonicida]KAH0573586.1 hypothetical protein SS50377_23521 [Spironucleus salmonicida]|eukprot:EST48505.1 Hypothetical protein SS50377_11115 [Spironucleus salmonicida]
MSSLTKQLIQAYEIPIGSDSSEQFTDAIYLKFISPLTAYFGESTNFLEIITTFQNISGNQLILTELSLQRGNTLDRNQWISSPQNQLNAAGRLEKPRKQLIQETEVDGHILRYLSTLAMHPVHQQVRKGLFFRSLRAQLRIFRIISPGHFATEFDGSQGYSGSQHPANAPQNQFGHDFVSDSLIGRFQQEVICSIPSQFDSEPTLHIEITAQGEQNVDDQQLGLGIIELENIVGGMENVKTQ